MKQVLSLCALLCLAGCGEDDDYYHGHHHDHHDDHHEHDGGLHGHH